MREKKRVAQEQVKIFEEYIKNLEKFKPIADDILRKRNEISKRERELALANEAKKEKE